MNAAEQPSGQAGTRPVIVLVHGAFADASSWNGVIEPLQQQGYTVIAPANPLRGVTADSAYTASLLGQAPHEVPASIDTTTGPAHQGGSYSGLPNLQVGAANGIDYAYRDTGPENPAGAPLVLLQRFRGNLDNWDPALIDALASSRRVLAFDNAGVGSSTGATPNTVEQMAYDAIAFIAALDLTQVDLMGFSIGSFVAQQIALTRPALVRRLILASAAPQGAVGNARLGAGCHRRCREPAAQARPVP